jgi:diguanylate cyclase (GGDEF)-like protein
VFFYTITAVLLLGIQFIGTKFSYLPLYNIQPEDLPWLVYVFVTVDIVFIALCLEGVLNESKSYQQYLEQSNITLKRKKELYHHLAHHDALTNLHNKHKFEIEISKLIQDINKEQSTLAIFYMDIDKLKTINDTYGHVIGDSALRHAGKRLSRCFRDKDLVARIGGDEFAAVVIDPNANTIATTIAERIQSFSNEPITIDNCTFFVSISIGIAIYPKHGDTIEAVINNADKALYVAKQLGRSQYATYHE